jgi:hypothetical protein
MMIVGGMVVVGTVFVAAQSARRRERGDKGDSEGGSSKERDSESTDE